MPTALLTDLHANREALEACLLDARRAGATRFAFLGDLVGYGADPEWVVDTVESLAAEGAPVVQGNHDRAVVDGIVGGMHGIAGQAIAWTRTRLGPGQVDFLRGLPMSAVMGDALLVHANAWAPSGWEYIESAFEAQRSLRACTQRLVFHGHVHEPALYHVAAHGRPAGFTPVPGVPIPLSMQRRWLAIPGAVGQPRDGIPAACWALLDDRGATLTFFRVPYDNETAARKVRAAGLPESLATRLETGR